MTVQNTRLTAQQDIFSESPAPRAIAWHSNWFVAVFASLICVLCWFWLPEGGKDWRDDIRPAIRDGWAAPWEEGLPLPPWSIVFLSPLALLSARGATAAIGALAVVVVTMLVRRFRGPDWIVVPIILSPSGFWLLKNGQTEWLMLLGVLFANGFDVMLLVLKPQVTLWVVPTHLRRAGSNWWKYLLPSLVLISLSLVFWPLWPFELLEYREALIPADWNASLWPYSVPFGLIFLWRAWQTGDERWGLLASPFLFPYVNLASYIGVFVVIFTRWPRFSLMVYVLGLVSSGIIFFVI